MSAFRNSFRTIVERFRRDGDASAVVEFALILPILLLLYVGTVEASSLLTVDRRVNIISSTVGDLVSRWDPEQGTMPSATLNDYFRASQGIIIPYSQTGIQQVVTFVQVFADGSTQVRWSRSFGGATPRVVNTPYTIPPNLKAVATPGYIVATEVSYPFEPGLGIVLQGTFTLRSESFYLPRFDSPIAPPV